MCSIRPLIAQVLALLFAISSLVTGCASSGNTLKQQLAQAAWDACQAEGRIPNQVQLTRIDVNGGIHWFGLAGSFGFADAQKCIQEKYRGGTLAVESPASISKAPQSPTASPATSTPLAALPGSMLAPAWTPGDEWAFRWESPAGKGTYVWSVDREEMVEGVSHYVIKVGTREIFYRKSDIASTRETVDGATVLSSTPSRLRYAWPLQVGKTWEQTYQEERPVARQTAERVDVVTVEAEESVTVPAGTFKTFKIVYRNKKTGAIRYEEWYSPELKSPVKFRENLDSGLRVRELIAFKLR